MPHFTPPTITPPTEVLGVLASLKAMRENALNVIPEIAYNQPIVTGTTGQRRWHMVQGPEAMKQVFLDKVDQYPKADVIIRMLRAAVGESLFTSEGPAWRWQRRAIAPVFAARNVSALAPLMTATAERTVERLEKVPTGPAEMVQEMLSATFDVICDVALSGRAHFDTETYCDAVTHYMLTAGRASLLDFLDVPNWLPRPGELLAKTSVKTMHEMVSKAIKARQRQGPGEREDLLDYMLKANDPETGRTMNAQDLLYNLQFFIVAGHETTALTLAWALYLIAHDPDVQARAHEEARNAITGEAATAKDLENAPYIEQILDETMRLYPPVGFLARKALAHDQIYDRDIKPRDTVFLNIFALHRHHDLWSKPALFNPENFTAEQREKRNRFQFVPFGAGPRICVGANFAMLQAQIILTTLLARFHFEASGPAPIPTMQMTIRPEPGINLSISPL